MLVIYLIYLTILQSLNLSRYEQLKKIQLKLFDIAVTFKYYQGHYKWSEEVKLNEKYHHAKFNIDHIYRSEKIPMLKFSTSLDT